MKYTVDKVISAKKGDKEAFSQLYEEIGLDLYKMAVYTLGNKDDAEDVVLETVEAAYKGIKSLRDPNRFGAWIMKILSNKCKAKIREYVRQSAYPQTDACDASLSAWLARNFRLQSE